MINKPSRRGYYFVLLNLQPGRETLVSPCRPRRRGTLGSPGCTPMPARPRTAHTAHPLLVLHHAAPSPAAHPGRAVKQEYLLPCSTAERCKVLSETGCSPRTPGYVPLFQVSFCAASILTDRGGCPRVVSSPTSNSACVTGAAVIFTAGASPLLSGNDQSVISDHPLYAST